MSRLPLLVCLAGCVVSLVSSLPLAPEQQEVVQLPLDIQEALAKLQLAEQSYEEETPRDKRTIGVLRQLFPGLSQTELNPEENQLSGAESQQSEVRVQYGEDQELAASGGNSAPSDNAAPAPAADADSEEADRNKRLINFGFGASAGTGGSGGGSGNFLFDIIRLVAGSGNTEPSGESASASAGASADAGVVRDDGYQAGVPGPITRLFIIANRGIANLMQDLILRLAQTSERIVNFKARLITSII
ncbi:uncharacterized protein LOC124606871 isoform X1 [Schistocerca americana]|uniref:uncharacterized protein LOC124606871 isoform X1 n=1 Tax=Schistocerca americana TaxID=7009 RepID=UPI001F4FA04C|nr:uncharacterized protein LOC124606871 isoform X1 [Schistocerca americana]XP_049957350.1 uncharacterized protein LOC126474005 isoform X1 [Schistocerca serialis cubense]